MDCPECGSKMSTKKDMYGGIAYDCSKCEMWVYIRSSIIDEIE